MRKSRANKMGLPPGSLVHVGEQKVEHSQLTLIRYSQETFTRTEGVSIDMCRQAMAEKERIWINVDGIHHVELIQELGEVFGVNALILEDILNTDHRPKLEDCGDYLFMILKMLEYDPERESIAHEQISILLGPNYVISFQEKPGDVFQGVRDRLQRSNGRIRQRGSDYLAYALLDSLVDSYYLILERMGEKIEQVEQELASRPTPDSLQDVYFFKHQLIVLRRSLWPVREISSALYRGDSALVRKETGMFLRDLYDHTVHVVDTLEIYREVVSGMLELYMSSLSNRMNEVMKVLTIMATIFIPLTFIAGVYGMNFSNMPELKWRWGYPAVWLVMLGCVGVMLVYFRKKKWL